MMRKNKHLNRSIENEEFTNINGSERNPDIINIISKSKSQKIENMLNF